VAAVWLQQRAGTAEDDSPGSVVEVIADGLWPAEVATARPEVAISMSQQVFRGSPEPSGICRPEQDPAEVAGVESLIDVGG
jgi:hypothetical protein